MRKCKCGNEVASNGKFCPKCGHRFTSGLVRGLAWFIGLITLISIIAISQSGTNSYAPQSPTVQAATSAPVKPPTPAEKVALRKAYAKVIDQQLLDTGIESRTYTVGADAKTLVIEDALAGRVRQNSIQQNDNLFDNLRTLGFTHLKYTNNFESELNYGVVWTIKP